MWQALQLNCGHTQAADGGQFDKAVRFFQAAVNSSPKDSLGHFALGNVMIEKG